jgi:hypothetical protein
MRETNSRLYMLILELYHLGDALGTIAGVAFNHCMAVLWGANDIVSLPVSGAVGD